MGKITEVVVFSEQGDPREVKTWSNVPYFLVETLAARNIKVHTVDLSSQSIVRKVVARLYDLIFSKVYKGTEYPFNRSAIHNFLTTEKIKRAVKDHEGAQLFIFTTFSFSASKLTSKPSILFCDWTLEYYLEYFLERPSNSLERYAIEIQNNTIENAAAVFVLFPAIAATMQQRFSNRNIFYNGNVVNNALEVSSDVIELKRSSYNLLFIGSTKYMQGARELINAFVLLKKDFKSLKLHIVGIDAANFSDLPEDVYSYGYLDKSNFDQADKYYELLRTARVFINTTPKWASFSSSLEAMYFSTPLIITAYNEFIHTFGDPMKFGFYYRSGADNLIDLISNLLVSKEYDQMCKEARLAAEEHSWDSYVDRMIDKMSPLIA